MKKYDQLRGELSEWINGGEASISRCFTKLTYCRVCGGVMFISHDFEAKFSPSPIGAKTLPEWKERQFRHILRWFNRKEKHKKCSDPKKLRYFVDRLK